MEGPKHQRKMPETAPSTGESVYDTKTRPGRETSSTDVPKSIGCLSMKSDYSKGTPPVFSWDPPDNEKDKYFSDRLNKAQHFAYNLKEAGQRPVHPHKDHLLKEQNAESLLEGYQRELKSSLKQKYKRFIKRTQGIRVNLREEREESGELHQMNQSLVKQKVDCTELFRARSVRTVLTTGSDGVGKSVLVQRSIVDWCEDRALQHVQLLCPLSFPQLNLLQQQSWTLMELLQTFCPGLRESGFTNLSHLKLLIILDGLDQCKLPLDFSIKHSCNAETPMPVDALLSNLMLGNLLPDAQLWILSRPTAARSIPPTLIHRVSEVCSHQTEADSFRNIQDPCATECTKCLVATSSGSWLMNPLLVVACGS